MKTSNLSIKFAWKAFLMFLFCVFLNSATLQAAPDGQAIFKQSCAMCHATTKAKLVGPGLEGITTKRTEEWLLKWIKDSQGLIASGDADAKTVFEENGKSVMPPFATLTDDDIKAILGFLSAPPAEAPAAAPAAKAPVAAPPAELTAQESWLIAIVCFLIVIVFLYLYTLKQKLRGLGYAMDKEPLRDRISAFTEKNGKLFVFVVIVVALFLIIKWTSSM